MSQTYTMKINGAEQTLTEQDSIGALRRDYRELMNTFDPDVVTVKRTVAPKGSMALLEFTVSVLKYRSGGLFYLDTYDFQKPKETEKLTFYMNVYHGYPAVKPEVYYPANRRNAHVNVFPPESRDLDHDVAYQCTGDFEPNSSLTTLARKVILSILHDETLTDYDSTACRSEKEIKWQKEMAAAGKFPAIPVVKIHCKQETAALIGKKPGSVKAPPLPGGGRT